MSQNVTKFGDVAFKEVIKVNELYMWALILMLISNAYKKRRLGHTHTQSEDHVKTPRSRWPSTSQAKERGPQKKLTLMTSSSWIFSLFT